MIITTRGSIKFSEGSEGPTSVSVPKIYSFEVKISPDSKNQFSLCFSVDNCASLKLEKSLINENGVTSLDTIVSFDDYFDIERL